MVPEEDDTWFKSGRDWPRQENTGTWILRVFGLVHFLLGATKHKVSTPETH